MRATPPPLTGGSIAGNITARDGALAGLQTSLNTLASQLITQVNNIYSAGCNPAGGTGHVFFTGTGASDIAVNSALVSDPSQFQASSTPGAGSLSAVPMSADHSRSVWGRVEKPFMVCSSSHRPMTLVSGR